MKTSEFDTSINFIYGADTVSATTDTATTNNTTTTVIDTGTVDSTTTGTVTTGGSTTATTGSTTSTAISTDESATIGTTTDLNTKNASLKSDETTTIKAGENTSTYSTIIVDTINSSYIIVIPVNPSTSTDPSFIGDYDVDKEDLSTNQLVITYSDNSQSSYNNVTVVSKSYTKDDTNYGSHTHSAITKVNMGSGITGVDDYAFYGCDKLTYVHLSSSMQSVGKGAFFGCSNLSTINFTSLSSLTTIKPYAFSYTKISNIIFPSALTTIGNRAFMGCSSLKKVDASALDSTLTTIGDYAFAGTAVNSFRVPANVSSLGEGFLNYAKTTSSLTVASSKYNNNSYNAAVDVSTNTIIQGIVNSNIANTTTTIGRNAYRGCDCTYNVFLDFPNSIENIDEAAFYGCNVIGFGTLTSKSSFQNVHKIGKYAFAHCYHILSIYFGSVLTEIGEHAFDGCYNINYIEIKAKTAPKATNAFLNIPADGSIGVPSDSSGYDDAWRIDSSLPAGWKIVKI